MRVISALTRFSIWQREDAVITTEEKITTEELKDLFGVSIPMDVIRVLFDNPDAMTIGEARQKIRAMANPHRVVARDLVIRIAETISPSLYDIDPRLCEGEPLHEEIAAMLVKALDKAANTPKAT